MPAEYDYLFDEVKSPRKSMRSLKKDKYRNRRSKKKEETESTEEDDIQSTSSNRSSKHSHRRGKKSSRQSDYESSRKKNSSKSIHSKRSKKCSKTSNNKTSNRSSKHNSRKESKLHHKKIPTCCRHGRRCTRGREIYLQEQEEANKIKNDDTMIDEEQSSTYEVADRFLKRESISGKEIAHMRKSKKKPTTSTLTSRCSYRIYDESEIEDAMNRQKAYVLSPTNDNCKSRCNTTSYITSSSRPSRSHSRMTSDVSSSSDRYSEDKKYSKGRRDPLTNSESCIVLKEGDLRSTSSSDILTREKYAPASFHPRRPIFEKMKMEGPYDEKLHKYYLGEITPIEAERRTRERVSFRLYHQVPLFPLTSYDQLEPSYKLHIVYRCSKGYYFHYPIIKNVCRSSMGNIKTQLTVEYGEPAPFFNSLSVLIKHYETYATFNGDGNCLGLPDIFPWKIAEKEYCSEAILNRKTLNNDSTSTYSD